MDERKEEKQEVKKEDKTNSTEKRKFSVLGLISFLVSLVGLWGYGIPLGIVSISLGIVGLANLERQERRGKWMLFAGLIIGTIDWLGVLVLTILVNLSII